MLSSQPPSEIVFPAASTSTLEPCIFSYENGPIKLKSPRRRGRPLGSTKNSKSHTSERSRRPKTYDDQSYHFVHVAAGEYSSNPKHISDETRTTIRKQVMANYVQRKRKRVAVNESEHDSVKLVHRISHVDPFDAFPVKLEPYMLDLLRYYTTTVWRSFYTIESHTSVNPMTDFWMPIAFYDDALLHLLIGCADAHVSRYKTYCDRSSIAIKHMCDALSIVKVRIASPMQSVTDETIAVIATLAFVEKFRGYYSNWRIHMKGLKRMVDLRGGLGSLEKSPMIMGKVFRADLCGSIDTVQTPFFSRHYSTSPLQKNTQYYETGTTTGLNDLYISLDLDETILHTIHSLNEATRLTASLLRKQHNSQADAARIRFLITQTQYTLLSTPKYTNQAQELCRVVLLLYSESMVNESPPRLAICDELVGKFRDMWIDLDAQYIGVSSHDMEGVITPRPCVPLDLRLWAMFVAASVISIPRRKLMGWYLRSIIEIAFKMGLDSWSNLVSVFDNFLWDSIVHETRYLEIWSEAQDLCHQSQDSSSDFTYEAIEEKG